MTSKERFLTALNNEVPDRVPVAPDISNYIPCKRTGLPFWDIYFREKIPLWKAYLEAADYFGMEAWVASCTPVPFLYDSDVETNTVLEAREDGEAMVERITYKTSAGELSSARLCFRADPPTPIEKPIKDLAADWEKYALIHPAPTGIDTKEWDVVRKACAERQAAFGISIGYPGFQAWMGDIEGGIAPLCYAQMDAPELLARWFEHDMAKGDREMELLLGARPDYIMFGGSGTITLSSPELVRKYAMPALKKWSRMAKDAGIATHLHCCGKSRELVDMLVEETDVGSINPLEIRPMGDVDLAEVKQARGKQIGLMGNLHTTDVMLNGTVERVRTEAIEAMRAAGEGGGFVLSTGDQCGRETPEENIFALIESAKEFGVYNSDGQLDNLPEV